MKKAVILFSGGLDSTTCLACALDQGYACYTLSFDYGQKHRVELDYAARAAQQWKVAEHRVMSMSLSALGGSALTDATIDVQDHVGKAAIPLTYVPARNTVFLSFGLAWAEVLDAQAIFIGVSSVDYSGYPDCRPEYIEAFQNMAGLATKRGVEGSPVLIETPLLHLTKADTIKMGLSLDVDYSRTVSCYRADDEGRACGKCDSCVLRKQGFAAAQLADPTHYVQFA
jgi:7-cyano-7-deazaguanine synthase